MEIFSVENLSFSYPNSEKSALKNISFTVNEGDFFLICGESGSGKSTLLRMLKPELAPAGKKAERFFTAKKALSL
ncbi:MAG: ATP-binding cassette domain-containing protein [bacterium]|nr:ATP-binding cassette domain-containing protein [bacterium]